MPKTFAPKFRVSNTRINYYAALEQLEADYKLAKDKAVDTVWLLEHNHVYTAGSSAKDHDLLIGNSTKFKAVPVVKTVRGGQFTYHGPGQKVVYLTINLDNLFDGKALDIRKLVQAYEQLVINVLAKLGIKGERRAGRIGIWVAENNTEAKITAIGLRVRKKITSHGFCLNINPDLSYYQGIVPCGISEYGVTSVKQLLGEVPKDEMVNKLIESEVELLQKLLS
ncbi:MAG: lipoyl(octanoyl) transferase LipB [Pseudomonadota bacterium]